jgi:hypothetical protein
VDPFRALSKKARKRSIFHRSLLQIIFYRRFPHFAKFFWGYDLQEEHDFIEKSRGTRFSRGIVFKRESCARACSQTMSSPQILTSTKGSTLLVSLLLGSIEYGALLFRGQNKWTTPTRLLIPSNRLGCQGLKNRWLRSNLFT